MGRSAMQFNQQDNTFIMGKSLKTKKDTAEKIYFGKSIQRSKVNDSIYTQQEYSNEWRRQNDLIRHFHGTNSPCKIVRFVWTSDWKV